MAPPRNTPVSEDTIPKISPGLGLQDLEALDSSSTERPNAERPRAVLLMGPQSADRSNMAEQNEQNNDDAYELSVDESGEIPAEWEGGAIYTLELPARCPYCREPLRSVRVLRLRRTQVTFTSTLPRGGRAIVCPDCERIMSVELAAL
jgi:hypothetical protein